MGATRRAQREKPLDELGRSHEGVVPVRVHRLIAWVSLGMLSFGCDNGGAEFTTRFASDFAPARHTVSVLGVYQDGRMALDTWPQLAPYLTRALGPTPCAVGFDALVTSNQDLANAIDEFARDEGPTANLLTQLAPAAQGELVLVVTFAGKLPAHPGAKGAAQNTPAGAAAAPPQTGMGGGRRRGGGRHAQQAEGPHDTNQLDVSVSLFSVLQGKSVALVGMQYKGESVADALTRFGVKLSEAVPDLKCVGWNWSVNIDPKRIHAEMPE